MIGWEYSTVCEVESKKVAVCSDVAVLCEISELPFPSAILLFNRWASLGLASELGFPSDRFNLSVQPLCEFTQENTTT